MSTIRNGLFAALAGLALVLSPLAATAASAATAPSPDPALEEQLRLNDLGPTSGYSSRAVQVSTGLLAGFDPELLLSDFRLDDYNSMTQEQIGRFIDEKNVSCLKRTSPAPGEENHNPVDPPDCLKDIVHVVTTAPATTAYCGPITTGEKTSEQVIWEVAQACKINPQVLLVMLQKEQGLVTGTSGTNPTWKMYERAMGAGCPDSTPGVCDPTYASFQYQVYSAASRLNAYRDPARKSQYPMQVGATRAVLYHPSANTLCPATPSQTITFRSAATAALYTYTPYVPNQIALDKDPYPGDACSSYGNRNFFRTFAGWFGQPNYVHRVAGADRYATAAKISSENFAPGVAVAYVATGVTSVDALSIAPVAGNGSAPVLLTEGNSLPATVAAELTRLKPGKIVIVGGTGSISAGVESALRSYSGTVERVWGANRYATAAAISAARYTPGVQTVYLASGVNPADALSIAPVAAAENAPLLLSEPGYLPAETVAELVRLNPANIVLIGGTGALNDNVAAQAGKLSETLKPSVSRIWGADRFATAAQISTTKFAAFSDLNAKVYVASGFSPADALAIAPVAGMLRQPVLLSDPGAVPGVTSSEIARMNAGRVIVVGGTGALSTGVEAALQKPGTWIR